MHLRVDDGLLGNRGAQRFKFLLVRQAVIPEQIDDFLVTGVRRQVFDFVAGVNQLAFRPVDQAQAAGTNRNAVKPFLCGACVI